MKLISLPTTSLSSKFFPPIQLLLSVLPSLTVTDTVAIEKINNILVTTSKEVIFNPSTPTLLKAFCFRNVANVKFISFFSLLLFAALLEILMTVAAVVPLVFLHLYIRNIYL